MVDFVKVYKNAECPFTKSVKYSILNTDSMNQHSMSRGEADMTRKEQKEMRSKQIMFKALELFVTKGYSETKISDIAEALEISTGLLFHYYESKEKLCCELLKMGVGYTKRPENIMFDDPLDYFKKTLEGLLGSAKEQPMVYQMFVLMAMAKRPGLPEEIRAIAAQVDQIQYSAEIIRQGQEKGTIKDGDPLRLSFSFWGSVQGIMEMYAVSPDMELPEVDWILDIIRKDDK